MAKYIGSPYGILIGKLGPTVAFYRKGQKIVRVYRKSLPKGSNKFIAKVLKGNADKSEVNIRQANSSRIFGISGYLTKIGRRNFTYPVWYKLSKGKPLTPHSLFVKRNPPLFYHSIPQPDKFIFHDNLPNLQLLRLTDGILEESRILNAEYQKDTIKVKWDTKTLRNGNPDDKVHLFVIHWKIPKSSHWFGTLRPWENLKLWSKSEGSRKDGEATIKVEKNS